jgi:Tfp pilus assembly protein PilF
VSLLLDALKKAEKAKEAARRGDKKSDAPGEAALSLEPTPEEANRVMTRDKLPDISAPLDIVSEDLSPRQAQVAAGDMPPSAPAQTPPSAAAAARPGARQAQGNAAAQRAAAQSVFQAKFKEPNPRLPFFVALGVLGAFAVGTIVYFWIQLRPPPPLVNLNPTPAAGEAPVASAPAPAPRPAIPAGAAPAGQAIPGLPGGAAPQPAAAPAPKPAPKPATPTAAAAPSAQPAAATSKPTAEPVAAGPAPTAQSGITRSGAAPAAERAATPRAFGRRTVARVNPGVAAGYAAYQSGDLERARLAYQQALRAEPRNIDALLGMAAVELRAQDYAAADRYYQRVLRLDPRNPHAHAGMLALRNQEVDPVMAESRVKSLMAREPGADGLQFTLGNQYAQQGRWGEAQQAYFKALASDPKNPDFAYNLAVSLDHLRQVKPALQHYRLAVQLAEGRGAGFDAAAVRARIAQLER